MRAKVSLSLALASDPELLVLDEPTSGLDTIVRREFLESMIDRAATGKTVLLASHQINEVERVADIIAIIRGGHLLMVERLDELKACTREVTITLAGTDTETWSWPTDVIWTRQRGRQLQCLLRCADEDALNELNHRDDVKEVQVRTPSLEEIFVATMLGCGDASEIPNPGTQVVPALAKYAHSARTSRRVTLDLQHLVVFAALFHCLA
jgi:ABC-2 type transport system ATP-binding protein